MLVGGVDGPREGGARVGAVRDQLARRGDIVGRKGVFLDVGDPTVHIELLCLLLGRQRLGHLLLPRLLLFLLTLRRGLIRQLAAGVTPH